MPRSLDAIHLRNYRRISVPQPRLFMSSTYMACVEWVQPPRHCWWKSFSFYSQDAKRQLAHLGHRSVTVVKINGKVLWEAMQNHNRSANHVINLSKSIRANEAENDSGQSIHFLIQKTISMTHSRNRVYLVSAPRHIANCKLHKLIHTRVHFSARKSQEGGLHGVVKKILKRKN